MSTQWRALAGAARRALSGPREGRVQDGQMRANWLCQHGRGRQYW